MKLRQFRRPDSSPVPVGFNFPGGFSMLELLLVVAILVLLVTLYWSPSSGGKQRALQVTCGRNLQKLSISMQLFATDNNGSLPVVKEARNSAEALAPLVPRYNSDVSTFICPGSRDSVAAGTSGLKGQQISYAYYMGRSSSNAQQVLLSDAQVNTNSKTVGQAMFSSDGKAPGNNHEKSGGNLLFGDGHVQSSPPRAGMDLPVGPGETLLNP